MDLDYLLTPAECAEWLRIDRATLSRHSQGRQPRVPAIRAGGQTVRYHPRTILAKFASEAGMSPEAVAASLNQK